MARHALFVTLASLVLTPAPAVAQKKPVTGTGAGPVAVQRVALTRDQVLAIWRSGNGILCLHDAYDIKAYGFCIVQQTVIALSRRNSHIDLTDFHIPADIWERYRLDGLCPYETINDRLACVGFADLFAPDDEHTEESGVQSEFNGQVLRWVAPYPVGARIDTMKILNRLRSEFEAATPGSRSAPSPKTGDPK